MAASGPETIASAAIGFRTAKTNGGKVGSREDKKDLADSNLHMDKGPPGPGNNSFRVPRLKIKESNFLRKQLDRETLE